MTQISQCPECGKSLRIPDEKVAAVVKCPKCGKKFRASGESAGSHSRSGDAPGNRREQEEASVEDDYGAPPVRSRKPKKKMSSAPGNLQPFLRRWMIACGIVLAVAALFGVGGLFSEIVAIIATGICVVAIVGCLLVGTIWMAIDLGKENVMLGVAVVLGPAVGPTLAFLKKGPALRGAVVFVSVLAPALLAGLMLLVFYPKYSGTGQQAVQTAKWEDLMRQLDSKVTPETPVVTAGRLRDAGQHAIVGG